MTNHQAQRIARRKLQAAARSIAFARAARVSSPLPPVLFMTDQPDRTPDLLAVAARLPPGWGLIYRHFADTQRAETAARLATIARRRGLILLIAADPALARSVGAHGVHWPARLLVTRSPRQRFSFETASAHNARELLAAARAGVSAAICSPVFPSSSPSAGRPIGLQRFLAIVRTTPIPVYALGGVSAENAGRLTSARTKSLAGIAAVSSIHDAWNILGETR